MLATALHAVLDARREGKRRAVALRAAERVVSRVADATRWPRTQAAEAVLALLGSGAITSEMHADGVRYRVKGGA